MHITYSKDSGHTWATPAPIYGHGVLPQLLQLENGVMVLSFGRATSPGSADGWPANAVTVLMFSTDGGYTWPKTEIALYEPNLSRPMQCGYTSLLALDANSFLFGYNGAATKYPYPNKNGVAPDDVRKQLLVRKVTVEVG
jgi:hypothetical protein